MIKQGYIRKKGDHGLNLRYLVLTKDSLQYYINQGDSKPKGSFPLSPFTQISSITSDLNKRKKIYLFTVSHRYDSYQHYFYSPTLHSDEAPQSLSRSIMANSGKITALTLGGVLIGGLTAGVGILAGAMILGAGAVASGGALGGNSIITGSNSQTDPNLLINNSKSKFSAINYSVTFSCESFEEAEDWIKHIQQQIEKLAEKINVPSILLKRKKWKQSLNESKTFSSSYYTKDRINEIERWLTKTEWRVSGIHEGVRLLSPVFPSSILSLSSLISSCLRINLPINANVNDTFSTLLSFPASLKTGVIRFMEVIENIDAYSDIVYIQFHPIFVSSFAWTKPRDFCLLRYWKKINNNNYILCLDSTIHDNCPLHPDYIRGDLHLIYTISSSNKTGETSISDSLTYNSDSSLVSVISLLDPKGWVWTSDHINLFQRNFLMHIFDLKETLEVENYFPVYFEDTNANVPNEEEHGQEIQDEEIEEQHEEFKESNAKINSFINEPPSTMPPSMFAEAKIDGFKVRGSSYNIDGNKIRAQENAMFKFLCMDLIETKDPIFNISSAPYNRVKLAKDRGDDNYYFVFNLIVPGPPYLCFVSYYLVNKADINADTPFGRVASKFFSEECSNEYRNNRFKIIPKIIEGNFLVKAAVKDTPALIGNKLYQYYHRGENYFEIDVDVSSSAVAKNLCGLAMGYCKTIVLDMGLCLQGNEENELPEVIMGGVSFVRVDSSKGTKVSTLLNQYSN